MVKTTRNFSGYLTFYLPLVYSAPVGILGTKNFKLWKEFVEIYVS